MKTNYLKNPYKGLKRIIFLLLISPIVLNAQVADIPMHYEDYSWDFKKSQKSTSQVEEHIVEIRNANWLRLYFDDVDLGLNSYILLTSLEDGAEQRLDAAEMEKWGNSSAYFNGNKVKVSIHTVLPDRDISIKISEVEVGDVTEKIDKAICGNDDNRWLSSHKAVGRIMPIGCTGWIISNGNHITAGHCTGDRMNILEFNVPASASNGAIKHPAPEHQYTINKSSIKKGGSADWSVFRCDNNSRTGKTTIAAQNSSFNVVQTNSASTIRITGYGTDDGTRNQVQQTHTGPYSSSTSSKIYYQVDTKGGNSGSPIINNANGTAIGVHTHGGCTATGGNNSGTNARLGEFWNALNSTGSSSSSSGGGHAGWFDLGTPSSPIFTDYNRVTHQTTSGNYRWTNGNNLDSRDRGSGANNLNRDFVFSDQARTFEYTTANGTYDVVVTLGDLNGPHDNMVIKAEGQTKKSNIDRSAGQIANETFQVTVNDGKLSLEFSDAGGSNPHWVVNRIKIDPVSGSSSSSSSSSGGGTVRMRKRNASGFAIDGRSGGSNGQNIHLWSNSTSNVNQKWTEINRGGGYYSYKKLNTNYCIDGGNGGGNGQNVYLWTCSDNNHNQHWKKINVGSGSYRLEKRNAPAYSIDGGGGGSNGQNVYLWSSNNSNQNQHWLFSTEAEADTESAEASETESTEEIQEVITSNKLTVYPNPINDELNIIIESELQHGASIMIYNSTGMLVSSAPVTNNKLQMNTSHLMSGMYIMKLANGVDVTTQRFIKE